MKIAIVCHPTVGGSGVIATGLASHLARRGHELHVISSAWPHRLDPGAGCVRFHPVKRLPYPVFDVEPYTLSLANAIYEVSERFRIDLIHAHYAVPHSTAALLARDIGRESCCRATRAVTTLHGTDSTLVGQDESYRHVVSYSLNKSDGISAVSEHLKVRAEKEFGITGKVRRIYNFADPVDCLGCNAKSMRASLGLGEDPVVIHVSNFRGVKRIPDLIEAFARVRARVHAKLLLIGEGPETTDARNLVSRKNLQQDVLFLGDVLEPYRLLCLGDVFLLPSEWESFGLAALEAMVCGVPVVATRAGGLPEVIAEGETGFLMPVGDIEGLSERILELLDDEGLRRRMGKAGMERVAARFSPEVIVPQYESFYESVLDGKPSGG